MVSTSPTPNRSARRPRRAGVALMMCLFMVFMVSGFVLNIVQTETLALAATRNTIEYEQALYWANAGVHDACATIMQDASWRGTVTDGLLPPTAAPAGYSATATDDGSGNIVVTSTGYAGRGARTVQAVIEP
ncbi:MAG: hypothetical protein AAF805_00590 [Planctomycetota bacterium]